MDLETIRMHIDAGNADDDMRAALADRVMERLESRGDDLTHWERHHLGVALDILCSKPLAESWVHLDYACGLRDPSLSDRTFNTPDLIPSKRELWAKLIEVMQRIREREVTLKKSRSGGIIQQQHVATRDKTPLFSSYASAL